MIKVTILYPKAPGSKFDFDYYLNVHMPMSISLLGEQMQQVTVERVIDPGPPWPQPQFFAVCSFVCASRSRFESAFLPHMEKLQADTPNYTDVQQIVVISEIELETAAT